MERQMGEHTAIKTQNMLIDHLFQYRISPWPKTAEKRGFCTGVTDGPTDGQTDGRTDRPSYRDAFLTDASKNLSYTSHLPLCEAGLSVMRYS